MNLIQSAWLLFPNGADLVRYSAFLHADSRRTQYQLGTRAIRQIAGWPGCATLCPLFDDRVSPDRLPALTHFCAQGVPHRDRSGKAVFYYNLTSEIDQKYSTYFFPSFATISRYTDLSVIRPDRTDNYGSRLLHALDGGTQCNGHLFYGF